MSLAVVEPPPVSAQCIRHLGLAPLLPNPTPSPPHFFCIFCILYLCIRLFNPTPIVFLDFSAAKCKVEF